MNQTNHIKISMLLVSLLMLAGCESIPFIDNTSEYKGAGRAKPLEVPPDLTSASSSDTYSVPGGATTYSDYKQGGAGGQPKDKVLANPDNVKMERAGSQRWLVVDAPPDTVWPIIREFWNDLGFAVRVENPETGVMETEWIETSELKKDESGHYLDKFDKWLDKLSGFADRQKFRTRLERSDEEGKTEVYMTHRSVTGAPDDGKNRVVTSIGEVENGYRLESKTKPADALDDDLDAELLRRLMVKLGVEESKSKAIANAPIIEKRASVTQEKDGSLTLKLNDAFDRGWRRVGLALDRVGFVVEDKDRSNGVFYVRYTDVDIDDAPSKKKGLLDKLKFWGDDEKDKPKVEPSKSDKGVVDKLKFWKSDDPTKVDPSKQYRVKVDDVNEGTVVTITDKDGKPNRTTTGQRIITLLYDQLK